jgi:hypothetical protein
LCWGNNRLLVAICFCYSFYFLHSLTWEFCMLLVALFYRYITVLTFTYFHVGQGQRDSERRKWKRGIVLRDLQLARVDVRVQCITVQYSTVMSYCGMRGRYIWSQRRARPWTNPPPVLVIAVSRPFSIL